METFVDVELFPRDATVRLIACRSPLEFHLTFEGTDGCGYYAAFDGKHWNEPRRVSAGRPYRSGVSLAADSTGRVHFAWGEKADGGAPCIYYRYLETGTLGPTEVVQPKADHPECDLALDRDDRLYLAGTSEAEVGIGFYLRWGKGDWRYTEAPTPPGGRGSWAPAIACAEGGRDYLAFRNREGDSSIWWSVWAEGRWHGCRQISGHKFQPAALADKEGVYFTAGAKDRLQFMHVMPDDAGDYMVSTASISRNRGRLRGSHVALAQTSCGSLFTSHSTLNYPDTLTKVVRPGDRFFYHISTNRGRTWSDARFPTNDTTGQGFGYIASNKTCVMAVWPDIRGGRKHLRFSLWQDRRLPDWAPIE